jgi:hypothetical protein
VAPAGDPARDDHRFLAELHRHGREAVSFQGLKPGLGHWFDVPAPEGTGAAVAYQDTGSAWVAVGSPLADEQDRARAAERFAAAARQAGRRACFFGVEGRAGGADARPPLPGEPLLLGEQPVLRPASWKATLAAQRGLREQLRRARAKGVTVRRAAADEVDEGAPLRARIDELRRGWLASRAMEPMQFVVAVEPFCHAPEHRYYVAELAGQVVQVLSVVPIPARSGWLVEDLLRSAAAPNGTTELLLDALLADLPPEAVVTLGLAPLSGEVPRWMRMARELSLPLYDFDGLRAFKGRLHPERWEPVWLVTSGGRGGRAGMWMRQLLALLDSLRAFAGGSLLRFGLRSLLLHPSGPPWILALPLLPWTLLLMLLAVSGATELLAFSRGALAGWAVVDVALVALLFRAARRPGVSLLMVATLAAAIDAALSVLHLGAVGRGHTAWQAGLRAIATLAPVVGTLVLGWAAWVAHRGTARDKPAARSA